MRRSASHDNYQSNRRLSIDKRNVANSSWDSTNGTTGIENRLLTHSILSRKESSQSHRLHRQSHPVIYRQQQQQQQDQEQQQITLPQLIKLNEGNEEEDESIDGCLMNHQMKSSTSLSSRLNVKRVMKELASESVSEKQEHSQESRSNGDLIVGFPSINPTQIGLNTNHQKDNSNSNSSTNRQKDSNNNNRMIQKLAKLFPSSNKESSPSTQQDEQLQINKKNLFKEKFQHVLSSPAQSCASSTSTPVTQNSHLNVVNNTTLDHSKPKTVRRSLNDLCDSNEDLPILFEDSINDPTSARSKMKKFAEQAKAMPQVFDELETALGYESVPLLEIDHLPRGGLSIDTKAVGRIQFGIPPETIKDSMRLGIEVPKFYIVPTERFCREMGPALGINLSEFEFPAYFNYFVNQNQCTLVVDSLSAENNIRDVFGETLLGPAQFRNHDNPTFNEDEDFDPSYPKDARPNFYKEFNWFRKNEKTLKFDELCLDMLIKFQHFTKLSEVDRKKLGVPPPQKDLYANLSSKNHFDDSFGSTLTGSGKTFSATKNNNSTTPNTSSAPTPPTPPPNSLKRSHSNPNLLVKSRSVDEIQFWSGHGDDNTNGQLRYGDNNSQLRTSDCQHSIDSQISLNNEESSQANVDQTTWMYSKVTWLGEVATVYPSTATKEEIQNNSCPRVEIFKLAGGTEYVVHDINEKSIIEGKARFIGSVSVPDEIEVEGFTTMDIRDDISRDDASISELVSSKRNSTHSLLDTIVHINIPRKLVPPTFHPPSFGVTVLGNSHGFNKNGSVSGYVLWVNGRGVMIDPPPYSSATLEREGIRPRMIMAIIITHCHADHDAGAFQKVMTGSRVALITTPTIYKSFIRKYAALSGLSPELLRHSHRYRPAIIGQALKFQGATFQFNYTLHTIPCIAFRVEWKGRSIVFTGDHMNIPGKIDELEKMGVLAKARADKIRRLPLQECDLLLHESGAPPIHTPLEVLLELPEEVKRRLYVVHTAELPKDCELAVAPTGTKGTIRLDGPSSQDSLGFVSNPAANIAPTHSSNETQQLTTKCSADSSFNLSLLAKEVSTVNLRPTCVSDAWFILNLLSVVPFFSSLSYASTMDVLEMAQVEIFGKNEIVLPCHKRNEVLCVIWEGKCMDVDIVSDFDQKLKKIDECEQEQPTFWHAGDWTGPQILQPEESLSGERCNCSTGVGAKDIVAVSEHGVKVILLNMTTLHGILNSGSPLYRKYLSKMAKKEEETALRQEFKISNEVEIFMTNGMGGYGHASTRSLDGVGGEGSRSLGDSSYLLQNTSYNFMDILMENSTLSCLTAVQIRHLESLAEGPQKYDPGDLIWQYGHSTDYAYLITSGTAKFVDSKTMVFSRRSSTGSYIHALKTSKHNSRHHLTTNKVQADKQIIVSPNSEYAKLERILKDLVREHDKKALNSNIQQKIQLNDRKARHKFANKVLARLYARGAYTEGLIFSKGHFFSDTSRMVRGSLAGGHFKTNEEWSKSIGEANNVEAEHYHSSNLAAGPKGCSVLFFPRESFISFLDSHPGVLLTLLGSQVIV